MMLLFAMDLSTIKSEPNLERRSDLALDYASIALDGARDSYSSGDTAKWKTSLDEVRDAISLSYQSLEESGKNARNDKHFKKAELKTHEILRRLDGLRDQAGFEDRETIEKIRAEVSRVHDELLQKIMSRKK